MYRRRRRTARKGQVALEYLVMISFALLIASPLIIQAQQALAGLEQLDRTTKIDDVLDTAVEDASLVYSQGEPARTSSIVMVPQGVANSSIEGSLLSYTLSLRSGNASYFRSTAFDVNGSLPTTAGRYILVAEAEEGYVNISYR